VLNSLLGWLRKMIIAAWTDSLVLRELDLRHHLRAAGTFLEKTARNLFLLSAFCLDYRFLENRHRNLCARRRGRVDRDCARTFQDTRALTQGRTCCKDIIDQQHVQASHVRVLS